VTHDEVIKALGINGLAIHLGQKADTVRHWGLRPGGIPPKFWVSVMGYAAEKDFPLTYRMLAEAVAEAHAA
jgi:hypothetical protein